jgi:hypothetical protein
MDGDMFLFMLASVYALRLFWYDRWPGRLPDRRWQMAVAPDSNEITRPYTGAGDRAALPVLGYCGAFSTEPSERRHERATRQPTWH